VKTIPTIEPQRLAEIFRYEPETGFVYWREGGRKRLLHKPVGTFGRYLTVFTEGKRLYVHRIAWCLVHGGWPKGTIDHINGDTRDNRLGNLRDVEHFVNVENLRGAKAHSKTGFLGVQKRGTRFIAEIRARGEKSFLGSFPTAEEAHSAYLEAKRLRHEGCTL
jgi:hypothetical protein